ncbi:hypothetical protein, partial [Nostoc sp. NMS2]
ANPYSLELNYRFQDRRGLSTTFHEFVANSLRPFAFKFQPSIRHDFMQGCNKSSSKIDKKSILVPTVPKPLKVSCTLSNYRMIVLYTAKVKK